MPSENAKAVAREVIKHVRNGTKVNLGKIIREKGYAKSVSLHPDKITETKSYKEEVSPIVKALEEERNEIIKRLKKTRNKAKYRDLIDGLDKVTKNHQLLSGGKTGNEEVKITWE